MRISSKSSHSAQKKQGANADGLSSGPQVNSAGDEPAAAVERSTSVTRSLRRMTQDSSGSEAPPALMPSGPGGDGAVASAEMARSQIVEKAGVALLSQANQLPSD